MSWSPSRLRSIGIAVAVLILTVTAGLYASGKSEPDIARVRAGDNAEAGEVVFKLRKEFFPLAFTIGQNDVTTNLESVTKACTEVGADWIEQLFYRSLPPKDPNKVDLSCYYKVSFPKSYDLKEAIRLFHYLPEVEFAELAPLHKAFYTPNDPKYGSQWHLTKLGFAEAWESSQGDKKVVIGIVDTGLDMEKAAGVEDINNDIYRNLWLNPGEDIDHNDTINFEDWDFLDNDGNGYEDDFYGWNFGEPRGGNNWPQDKWIGIEPSAGHGTSVGGTASAVTDNGIGGAGAAFNCRLMYAACYSADNPLTIANSAKGVYYCAENGAQVINCSFGSFHYSRADHDVYKFAAQKGSVVMAATGNDGLYIKTGNDSLPYPVCYPENIGVGASGSDDKMSDFSNYGSEFSHLIAPGDHMLVAHPRHTYSMTQGTSFASPLAAGLAALLLSIEPGLTPMQVKARMQEKSVDISGLNPGRSGVKYRIDAAKLIGFTRPKVERVEWNFRQLYGNGDRWLTQTEKFALDVKFSNKLNYVDAMNVTYTIKTDNPFISIDKASGTIGNLVNGSEVAIPADQAPRFTIRGGLLPQDATITMTITSGANYTLTFDFDFRLGRTECLLLDDDDGATYETWYGASYAEGGYVYDHWDLSKEELPTQEELNGYQLVIWHTSNNQTPMNEDKQRLIEGYLAGNRNLLLSGQYIGDQIGSTDFHKNILHANHSANASGGNKLTAVEGNGIADTLKLYIIGNNGAGNGSQSPSSMQPINGAKDLVRYENGDGQTAGLVYNTPEYRLIYLGFAAEAISGLQGTMPQKQFMQKLFTWFIDQTGRTDVENPQPDAIVQEFNLSTPYPNPFNSQMSVTVNVPSSNDYRLTVVDLTGREVATLFDGSSPAGSHSFTWDGGSAPAGIYFVRLSWDKGTAVRKIAYMK